VCTVSGTTASLIASGTCTLRASQAGNGTYIAATSVNQGFRASRSRSLRSLLRR
jgi:hypothetical protein